MAGKRALVRLVRSPDGKVVVDGTGKAPGRGAYVHRDPMCLDAATKRGALARALRADIHREELDTLRRELEGVAQG